MSATNKKVFMNITPIVDAEAFKAKQINELTFEKNFTDYSDLALELDTKGSIESSKLRREIYKNNCLQKDAIFSEEKKHIETQLRINTSKLVNNGRLDVLKSKDTIQDNLKVRCAERIKQIIAENGESYKKSLENITNQTIDIYICNNDNAINVETRRFTSGGAIIYVNKRDVDVARKAIKSYNEKTKEAALAYHKKMIEKAEKEKASINTEIEKEEDLFSELDDIKAHIAKTEAERKMYTDISNTELIDLAENEFLPDDQFGVKLYSRDGKIVIDNTFEKRIALSLKATLPDIKRILNLPSDLID